MKTRLLTLTLLLVASFSSLATNYSLYLVRHAEKQADGTKDPALTRCGHIRAKQLAEMLKNIDIDIVYSTHYKRTMSTASPTATAKNLPIKQYAPNGLSQLVRVLKQKKQNALIVGHSNTTPQLLAELTESSVKPMTEKEYQHLFQVLVINGKMTVTDITQPLKCD